MNNSDLILLLQMIYAKANSSTLQRKGFEYIQIASLISESIDRGYIINQNGQLELTEAGLKKMRTDEQGNVQRKDGGWISPLYELRIEKMELDDVYLPNLENSYF